MSDFLSSYPFLDDAERDLLRKHGVDDADSVLGLGADGLVRHTQLSPGKAGKLVRAAERASTPTTAQPAVPTRDEQVRAALRQAAEDPGKVKALLDLGVQVVVLTPEDRVDPALSVLLHEHLAAGARVPATWRSRKIARVDQLATPPIWCSPRPPHRELQAGADEVSGVAWAALGVDGLRLAAHGYARGFFEGRAEEAAFKILMADEHSNPDAEKYARRIRQDFAASARPDAYDAVLFPSARNAPRSETPLEPPTGSIVRDVTAMFLAMFSAPELISVLLALPDGQRMVNNLPDRCSPSEMSFKAADILRRSGLLDPAHRHHLLAALVAARPHRAVEIGRVLA